MKAWFVHHIAFGHGVLRAYLSARGVPSLFQLQTPAFSTRYGASAVSAAASSGTLDPVPEPGVPNRTTGLSVFRRPAKILALAPVLLHSLLAHDAPTTKLTWTREISRLVALRCVSCHQPGGSAPFSLMTFADARPWAVAIKEEVLQRRMPPWPAAKGFGDFANDISLPQEEINRLAEWAEGGAPEGEPQWLRPAFAVPLWRPAAPPQGRVIPLPEVLTAPMTILAVRPVAHRKPLASEKSWAETAAGSVVPLVWLTGAAKPQWLIYRVPVQLPAGSRIRGRGLDVMVR